MKVRELIDLLEGLDQDEEVYFLPENSSYIEDFSFRVRKNVPINAFWGSDFRGQVIFSEGQAGGLGDE